MSMYYVYNNSDIAEQFIYANKGSFTKQQITKLREIMQEGESYMCKGQWERGSKVLSYETIKNKNNFHTNIIVKTVGENKKEIIKPNGHLDLVDKFNKKSVNNL